MEERVLTDKQARFVAEYVIDLNATQAAIRAGYSPVSAHGHRLLQNPAIKAAVNKTLAERARRLSINQDMVIEELARLALSRGAEGAGRKDIAPDRGKRGTSKAAKGGAAPEIRIADKLKALELLGRHLGMFKNKAEVLVVADLAEMLQAARERATRARK
jgi:phage terminase small subunit